MIKCTQCGLIKDESEFFFRNGIAAFPCKACKKDNIRNAIYEGDPSFPIATIKRGRGRPKKQAQVDIVVDTNLLHAKQVLKDTRIVVMEMSIFTKAIQLVFEQGKKEGKGFEVLKIEEHTLEDTINEAIRR